MAKLNIGGMVEEVITAEEFSLDKAREVLRNEVVAVIGYGVQGRGQALNMRDNGIKVIVGEGDYNWKLAIEEGFVPGETLFPPMEAARRGTILQYLMNDATQKSMWPELKTALTAGKALYFSHGFSIVYKEQTGVIPPPDIDVILVAPKGAGRTVRDNFLA
ncbi:MAG: ketol-acid reductoisomerase, partial [Syntrophales bacterium LBB04]|nr:ketol-acid reductoisomerase [Syntrophales bacterium LBB04]